MNSKQLEFNLSESTRVEQVPEGKRYEVCIVKCCGRPASIRSTVDLLVGTYCSKHWEAEWQRVHTLPKIIR